jgi:nucleotide-binding universal stress UspA family protein
MAYKTILVHCDGAKETTARVALAAGLAERYQAHLVGLHARTPFDLPVYDNLSVGVTERLIRDYDEAVQANETASSRAFAEVLKGRAVSNEWRSQEGYADDVLALNARYADLTVVGQTDPGPQSRFSLPSDLPERVAVATGRGSLVVPFIGAPKAIGDNILLCWNASREAARAATEALPLLREASAVTVLVVEPKTSGVGHGPEPGADVAVWLSRHGVKVTVQRDAAPDADVGSVILSRVMDHGCDLIVMGIYGHSRLREVILGGASRTLLSSMTVPVLMAH